MTTQGGDLSITGTVQLTGTTGNDNMGVFLEYGAYVGSTATGDVTVNGTGGAGNQGNYGVGVSLEQLGSQDGSLTVTGTGGGSAAGSHNFGVAISFSQVGTGGDGTASITGTGGLGTADAYGIYTIENGNVGTMGGSVVLIGTGGSAGSTGNLGVLIGSTDHVLRPRCGRSDDHRDRRHGDHGERWSRSAGLRFVG